MQTDEEGTGPWEAANDDCFDTYGGRLPFAVEGHIARENYALTNESEDKEWYADGGDGNSANVYAFWRVVEAATYSTSGQDHNTNEAYRCWIPAASMLAQ